MPKNIRHILQSNEAYHSKTNRWPVIATGPFERVHHFSVLARPAQALAPCVKAPTRDSPNRRICCLSSGSGCLDHHAGCLAADAGAPGATLSGSWLCHSPNILRQWGAPGTALVKRIQPYTASEHVQAFGIGSRNEGCTRKCVGRRRDLIQKMRTIKMMNSLNYNILHHNHDQPWPSNRSEM